MNRKDLFDLQRYLETTCMYDNCTPYSTAPKHRGNCLTLAMHYVEMASNVSRAENLHTHLVTRATPGLLEHAVVLYNDKTHLPWIIDIPYGILNPLFLGDSIDVYTFYRTKYMGNRLDLNGTIFDVDLDTYVQNYSDIEPVLFEYQRVIPCCSLAPIISYEYIKPFSFRFDATSFELREYELSTHKGEWNNGIDDVDFIAAVDKFFELMRDHYTNIPFKDEGEFLTSATEFLNGYQNLPKI